MPDSPPQSSPESRPVPDPAEYDIALLHGRNVGYSKAPRHIQISQLALTYGVVGTSIGILNLARGVAQSSPIPGVLFLTLAGAILLIAAFWVVRRAMRRSTAEGEAVGRLPTFESGESSRRIRVLTKPLDAIHMLRTLKDVRSGFEPEIARVPLAVGLDPAARPLAWVGGVLGLLCAALFELVFHRTLVELSLAIWFVMGMTALGAVGLPEFVFPTYVRVMPGRLDVIRAPLLGGGLVMVKSFDLRRRPLVLVGPVIFIEPEREEGEVAPPKVRGAKWPYTFAYPDDFVPDAVSLTLTPERRRILLATIWGATTEAPTPDIPADSLIG